MAVLKMEKEMLVHLDFCDETDQMKMSGIYNYFQDMAALHASIIGLGFDDTYNKGYYWILLYERIDVVKRPKMYEDVIVKTWPKKREKLEFVREFEMTNLANEPLVRGTSTWVLIDIKRRMIAKAKDVEFVGEFYPYTFYDGKPLKRLNLGSESYLKEFKYTVNYNDLDHNGHMNNAKYLDIIQIFEGRSIDYESVEVAYIKEALLNDVITIKYYKDDSFNCYIGFVNDTVAFEVRIKEKNND